MNIIPYYLMGYSSIISIVVGVLSLLYIFPILNALVTYEKRNWLKRTLASIPHEGSANQELKTKLLESLDNQQSFPLYKWFKFYLALTGIILGVSGILMILIHNPSQEIRDLLIHIPLLCAGGIYMLY